VKILLANLWQACALQGDWKWLSDGLRMLPQFSPLTSARISVAFYRFTNLLTFGAQISEPFIVYIESSKIGLEVTRYTASGHSDGCIAVAFSG